jgi:hypothetical protein
VKAPEVGEAAVAFRPADWRWRKACAGCGATYLAPEWQALPLSGTLAPETVQTYLSVPVVWYVEQRACRCGTVLSGLVRAA